MANDANCDNDLWCDGAETCDVVNDCENGPAPNCDDGVACTDDSCDEVDDECDNVPNNALCDNGLICDGSEICDALLDCQAGTPIDCSDGVACTTDTCNEPLGNCTNPPDDALCDNGDWCDGSETCDALLGCQPGTTVDCDDGVDCTDDSCDEVDDECDNIANDANCDDGAVCTVDTCDGVTGCDNDPVPLEGTACTVDLCSGTCISGVCSPCEGTIDPDSVVTTTSTCLTAETNAQLAVVVDLVDDLGSPVTGATVTMATTEGSIGSVTEEAGGVYWAIHTPPATNNGNATVTITADGDELNTHPAITIADPFVDPAGGSGGCPADGNVRITVLDAFGAAVPNAYVMIGDGPVDDLYVTSYGAAADGDTYVQTDGSGIFEFVDFGGTISGPITVTAGAASRRYMTFMAMDASDFILVAPLVDPGDPTAQYRRDIAPISAPTGDPIELGVMLQDVPIETLASFSLDMLLAPDECYDAGGLVGEQEIPGNIYIPDQWAIFFLQRLPEHEYLSAPMPYGERKLLGLRGSVPLDALLGGGGIGDALSQISLNGIGVESVTADAPGPTVQDIGISESLNQNIDCNFTNTPAAADAFCVSAGDWDSGSTGLLSPGEGRLFIHGFGYVDASGTGPWSVNNLAWVDRAGDFSGIEYIGAAVALYLDDVKAGIPSGTAQGISAIVDRAPTAFQGSGGTMTWNDFFPIRLLLRSARDFSMSAVPSSPNPIPDYTRSEFQQVVTITYPTCGSDTSSRDEVFALWIVYTPEGMDAFTLPTLPSGWPREMSGSDFSGLIDPAATGEDDVVRWQPYTITETINPGFLYDKFYVEDFRRYGTHITTNEEDF